MLRCSGRSKKRKYSAGKGCSATAALGCMGIIEDETGLHQALFVVQRKAGEIEEAFRIHDHSYAFVVEGFVRRTSLGLELELIAEARTTAAQDAQAEITLDTLF